MRADEVKAGTANGKAGTRPARHQTKRIMKTTKLLILAVNVALAATTTSHAQPNFTKITTGSVATDAANSYAACWVDFDGDGDLDLFTTNPDGSNLFYRNDGNAVFTRITSGPIVNAGLNSFSASWVDMNNDGRLDLYLAKHDGLSLLFLQQLDGSFTQKTYPMATISGTAWGDFDGDGFVDLLSADARVGMLWHNNGLGGLTVVPTHPINVTNIGVTTWVDYDADGHPDAFVVAGSFLQGTQTVLYRNNGHGIFTPITNGFTQLEMSFKGACWGDYDNDGLLDVFLPRSVSGQPVPSFLFHNHGDGTFTQVEDSPVTTDLGFAGGGSWGDYDNDGWLDLFISDGGGGNNRLYHNNGDGTFTSVLSGPVVSEGGASSSSSGIWGDYDRDGFLDLLVANGGGSPSLNYLYHNDGNSNAWLEVKCVGTRSNRSAIGAKVRVKATMGGNTFWQLREIGTGSGWAQNAMEVHFGLGNASNVETLRIEWPSGTVQERQNVGARQYLTLTEPSRLVPAGSDHPQQFTLEGGRNMRYDVQTSTNLTDWSLLDTITITNLNGGALISDTNAPVSGQRFYRAVLR
jgi:enediyne biosynthesis protein E4